MRRALTGRSGTVVGLDYRGVKVLAACEPVAVLDLYEIRAPFIRTAAIVAAMALILVMAGTVMFLRISDPMIRQLRESEERHRSLVELAPDAILITTADGVVFANSAAARLFGASDADELLGTTLQDLVHPDSISEVEARRQHVLAEKGFAKQSGGRATIYTEPGKGTTVKLYLPRAPQGAELAPDQDEAASDLPRGAGQTILVVEHDADVRQAIVASLSRRGFAVVSAASGAELLAQLPGLGEARLLLSEIVLPGGMDGREVAESVRAQIPGIEVLYMSGYTENAVVHAGRLDADATLIDKPFSTRRRLQEVNRILGL